MFARDEQSGAGAKSAETVIGPSIKVEGNFSGQGNIVVDGAVVGSLKTGEDITVGPDAKIQASMDARNMHIAGEIKGNLTASGKVELTSTARVAGEINAEVLSMEAGAMVDGKISVGKNQSGVRAESESEPESEEEAS